MQCNFTLICTTAAKLATTSTGIDVTGTATMDGLTVDGHTKLNGSFTVNGNVDTSASLGEVLQLSQTDSLGGFLWSADRATNTYKNMRYHADVHKFLLDATTEAMRISSGGDISFYEDTGTTAKLYSGMQVLRVWVLVRLLPLNSILKLSRLALVLHLLVTVTNLF
jgi:hypothetical protein